MANSIAMNAMYVRLGFTVAASALLSGAQGINGIMKLSLLTDVEVDALCKLVRLSGGCYLTQHAVGHKSLLRAVR